METSLKKDKIALMSIVPTTDAEKILWERMANKFLAEENRRLADDCDMISYKLKLFKRYLEESEKGNLLLKNEELSQKVSVLVRDNKRLIEKLKKVTSQRDDILKYASDLQK